MLLPKGMAGREQVRSSQPELTGCVQGRGNPSRDPVGGCVRAQGCGLDTQTHWESVWGTAKETGTTCAAI